jgi:hypothetical protein
MAQQFIDVGTSPNDGQGTPLRTAFIRCNNNFSELFSRFQTDVPSSSVGSPGDVVGMYAVNSTNFYYCFSNYDGSSQIWRLIAGSAF